jgi:hypothetical protein
LGGQAKEAMSEQVELLIQKGMAAAHRGDLKGAFS